MAEEALVRLAMQLGAHAEDIVVIGGLNADYLTDSPPAAHQGTTDVDILVQVGFVYDRDVLDFSWLERGLAAAGFAPRPGDETWRWWIDISGVPVKLELVCDAPDNLGQQIVLPGCSTATAMNLSGPAPAVEDAVVRQLPLPPQPVTLRPLVADGASLAHVRRVGVRFAGLGGYLLAKAAAVVQRGADKDYYDFAFVLLYNSGGSPRAAAHAALRALPRYPFNDHAGLLREALSYFSDPDAHGPSVFTDQMLAAGAEIDGAILRQDAVSAALDCAKAFDEVVRDRSDIAPGG